MANDINIQLPIVQALFSARQYKDSNMLILDTNLSFQNATTQYLGHEINSFCKFKEGVYLAASNDGLFRHDGNFDNGNEIESWFVTATFDFGVNNEKRLRWVYLSLEATGDLELTINTEQVAAITYNVPVDITIGQFSQDVRIPISRDLYGRFWTFKISNGNTGADFSIDEIKVFPLIRAWKH
jgi:hypothetical protein